MERHLLNMPGTIFSIHSSATGTVVGKYLSCCRCAGHKELADRLVECMYEVTDRLTFYICGKKPDHHIGKHFIVPDHFSASDPISLSKLQKVCVKR